MARTEIESNFKGSGPNDLIGAESVELDYLTNTFTSSAFGPSASAEVEKWVAADLINQRNAKKTSVPIIDMPGPKQVPWIGRIHDLPINRELPELELNLLILTTILSYVGEVRRMGYHIRSNILHLHAWYKVHHCKLFKTCLICAAQN